MNRYAWLEFNDGTWHLLTENPENRSRRWADKTLALSELAEEGWNISGPFPKRFGLDPTLNQSLCGFILSRAVSIGRAFSESPRRFQGGMALSVRSIFQHPYPHNLSKANHRIKGHMGMQIPWEREVRRIDAPYLERRKSHDPGCVWRLFEERFRHGDFAGNETRDQGDRGCTTGRHLNIKR